MSSLNDKKCGCKGIRTCLLCETQSETSTPRYNVQARAIYRFCPQCDLCWPVDEDANARPFYLGKLKLILDFITEEEEAEAVSAIDGIQWMPSQSGRRKQDFGPKVNFKKKKVKVGTFKGFPKFTEKILRRFENLPELSDFQAVELCHLEYSPERGSSIDPHVDDFWLWGERLVTVNLGSSTVLTLVPFSDDVCECREQSHKCFLELVASSSKNKCDCDQFHNFNLPEDSENSLFVSSASVTKNAEVSNIVDAKLNGDMNNPKLHVVKHIGENEFQFPTEEIQQKSDVCNLVCEFPSEIRSLSECFDPTLNEDEKKNKNRCYTNSNSSDPRLKFSTFFNDTKCDADTGKSIDMCSVFRRGCSRPDVAVRIVLPPRSLLILAGCARYNWYHEIKREHVVSRRLAMTFRELTPQFLEGGEESGLGKELLSIASNLCDFC